MKIKGIFCWQILTNRLVKIVGSKKGDLTFEKPRFHIVK
jgi:hypothetical protein